jgi:hypothetical protein
VKFSALFPVKASKFTLSLITLRAALANGMPAKPIPAGPYASWNFTGLLAAVIGSSSGHCRGQVHRAKVQQSTTWFSAGKIQLPLLEAHSSACGGASSCVNCLTCCAARFVIWFGKMKILELHNYLTYRVRHISNTCCNVAGTVSSAFHCVVLLGHRMRCMLQLMRSLYLSQTDSQHIIDSIFQQHISR